MCSGVSLLVTQAIVLTCILHFTYHQQEKPTLQALKLLTVCMTHALLSPSWFSMKGNPLREILYDVFVSTGVNECDPTVAA